MHAGAWAELIVVPESSVARKPDRIDLATPAPRRAIAAPQRDSRTTSRDCVGYVIVGLFVVTWAAALSIWHFGRIEEKVDREAPTDRLRVESLKAPEGRLRGD